MGGELRGALAALGKVTVESELSGDIVTAHLATAMGLLALLIYVMVRADLPAMAAKMWLPAFAMGLMAVAAGVVAGAIQATADKAIHVANGMRVHVPLLLALRRPLNTPLPFAPFLCVGGLAVYLLQAQGWSLFGLLPGLG